MEKPKIQGIYSEEYPKGRIDLFKIPLSEEVVYGIEGTFRDLGFSEEVINDLDMHYPSTKGYYFFYSPKIKAHLFFEGNFLNLVFDTNLPKKDIMEKMKKYFQIF